MDLDFTAHRIRVPEQTVAHGRPKHCDRGADETSFCVKNLPRENDHM